MRTFTLKTEYITLGQFLKAANVIGSGGEARGYLEQHVMIINGEQDNRRGRKLRENDVVTLPGGEEVKIVV
jgi:ribosome-associated protein